MNKITVEVHQDTAYSVWDSDENILLGVIVKTINENDGDEVDITEKVRTMIREHNSAYSVTIDNINKNVVLRPGDFDKIELITSVLESDEEGEMSDIRNYEIYPISVY